MLTCVFTLKEEEQAVLGILIREESDVAEIAEFFSQCDVTFDQTIAVLERQSHIDEEGKRVSESC